MSRVAAILSAALSAAALCAQYGRLVEDATRLAGQWCIECHRGEKPAGGLDLARFPEGLAAPDMTLQRAARRLRAGTMPPKKAPQPARADALALVARIDARFAATSRPGPGRVTLRRLSRYEYQCSIRD